MLESDWSVGMVMAGIFEKSRAHSEKSAKIVNQGEEEKSCFVAVLNGRIFTVSVYWNLPFSCQS